MGESRQFEARETALDGRGRNSNPNGRKAGTLGEGIGITSRLSYWLRARGRSFSYGDKHGGRQRRSYCVLGWLGKVIRRVVRNVSASELTSCDPRACSSSGGMGR
ncbi:hypothetical protein L2E82_31133 [Cichorium intybus]|uniref:Uncharacterized protein n=1 Tax=Cichorium intybus TaxID=13427 RepID=A0ACB9D224_CICIN|nr:hypothetical protein L2E82_31133 [Cichorium intybus]